MFIVDARDPSNVDAPPEGKFTIFIDSTTGHLTAKQWDDTLVVLSANPVTI